MFCPRCGDRMAPTDGTLKCLRGDMLLSEALRRRLEEVFVKRVRAGRSVPLNWGGEWHCPGCGDRAQFDGEHVRCLECGELMDEFLNELIELHPHRRRLADSSTHR